MNWHRGSHLAAILSDVADVAGRVAGRRSGKYINVIGCGPSANGLVEGSVIRVFARHGSDTLDSLRYLRYFVEITLFLPKKDIRS